MRCWMPGGWRRMIGKLLLGLVASSLVLPGRATASQPPPGPPSAIGRASVSWIAVSPAYARTGLVAAVASDSVCKPHDCVHLWVSRDGGSTWHRAAGRNWIAARLAIAVDGQGHEHLYTGTSHKLLRSDDDGENWVEAGAGGEPTVLATYAADGGVAVAGTAGDYLLRSGTATPLQGSAGSSYLDLTFLASPQFPDAGTYNPALLVALDRHTRRAVVLRCSTKFVCDRAVQLPDSDTVSAFTTSGTYLLGSSAYIQDGTVFAATSKTISKSTDGGATFVPLSVVPANPAVSTVFPMVALAPDYREHNGQRTAYTAVFEIAGTGKTSHTEGGLYRSEDGGATWSPLATTGPFAGGANAVAVAPSGRVFAGYLDASGRSGLLCSTDGTRWRASCPPEGTEARTAPLCSGTSCAATGGEAVVAKQVGGRDAASGSSAVAWGAGAAGGAVLLLVAITLLVPRSRAILLRGLRR